MSKTDALKVSNIEKLLQIDSTIRSDSRSANSRFISKYETIVAVKSLRVIEGEPERTRIRRKKMMVVIALR